MTRHLGAPEGLVNNWLYCDRRPSLDWAAKIESSLGIGLRLWAAPPVRPIVPPACKALDRAC